MYFYERQIFLRETDASGFILFSEKFNLSLEALENFLLGRGFSLKNLFEAEVFKIPVVRAEADFLAPLRVGDRVSVELSLLKRGRSSFTIEGIFKNAEGNQVGKTQVTHVCVSSETGKAIPISEQLISHLGEL